jgi:hypothetical protein
MDGDQGAGGGMVRRRKWNSPHLASVPWNFYIFCTLFVRRLQPACRIAPPISPNMK